MFLTRASKTPSYMYQLFLLSFTIIIIIAILLIFIGNVLFSASVADVIYLSSSSFKLLRSRGTRERLLILFRRRQKARIFGLQIGRPCKVFQGF